MKLLERFFGKTIPPKPKMDEGAFRALFESLGYDLNEWITKDNFAGAWQLYQEGRCTVSDTPKYMCQTQTSRPPEGWTPSADGHSNVAYMMAIAVPCPRKGHIYTEEWHGGLTQGVIGLYKCLEHGPSVSFFKSVGGDPRFMVIGSSRYVYDSVTDARLRGYRRDNRPDEIRFA